MGAREQLKRQFQRETERLKQAERVVWHIPQVDVDRRYRNTQVKEIERILKDDKHHGVSLEVGRLLGAYRAQFLDDLRAHEKRYNKGCMPQIQVACHTPRWPIEMVACQIFGAMVYEVTVDAAEEDPLLNPGKP